MIDSHTQDAIRRSRQQAKDVFNRVRSAEPVVLHSELDDELDRLGGKTNVVNRRPRTPTSSHRSSMSPDRMDESWSNRPAMMSTGWHGPQNKDPYGRFGGTSSSSEFGGDNFCPPYGQGLDSTWDVFIEQLGF